MLLLLFKNAMWAAWWPYYTMLLAMEKAATQAAADRSKSPPQAPQAEPSRRPGPHPNRSQSHKAVTEASPALEGPAGIVTDGVEGLVDGAAPAVADRPGDMDRSSSSRS